MYNKPRTKIQVPISWTKYLMTTHPVVFITTIGKVKNKYVGGIAPFATCLDTSYEPPLLTFSAALKQHSVVGKTVNKGQMNTYLNIKQYPFFIVNVPGKDLLKRLDVIAFPYERKRYRDKINLADLHKIRPFALYTHKVCPSLVQECLAHLECEVVDIHQPKGSDHYNITGKVVGASYDKKLGHDLDDVRENLVRKIWHHFGSNSKKQTERYIAWNKISKLKKTLIFHLEKDKNRHLVKE